MQLKQSWITALQVVVCFYLGNFSFQIPPDQVCPHRHHASASASGLTVRQYAACITVVPQWIEGVADDHVTLETIDLVDGKLQDATFNVFTRDLPHRNTCTTDRPPTVCIVGLTLADNSDIMTAVIIMLTFFTIYLTLMTMGALHIHLYNYWTRWAILRKRWPYLYAHYKSMFQKSYWRIWPDSSHKLSIALCTCRKKLLTRLSGPNAELSTHLDNFETVHCCSWLQNHK